MAHQPVIIIIINKQYFVEQEKKIKFQSSKYGMSYIKCDYFVCELRIRETKKKEKVKTLLNIIIIIWFERKYNGICNYFVYRIEIDPKPCLIFIQLISKYLPSSWATVSLKWIANSKTAIHPVYLIRFRWKGFIFAKPFRYLIPFQ